MQLSDSGCRSAKPKEKDYKLTDGDGMYLLIKSNGRKYWRMNYRFGGKSKTLALGVYPAVTLKEAREKRAEARKLLQNGVDPSKQKQVEKLTEQVSSADSFESVYKEWYEKKSEHWSEATRTKVSGVFERDLLPYLKNYSLSEITPLMLLSVLRKIEARDSLDILRKARSYLSNIFRYGIATGKAERDVAADLIGAFKTRPVTHNAYLSERELPNFLHELDGQMKRAQSAKALQLLILTLARTDEIRACTFDEFDLEEAVWRIPAERMKMNREHIVPLSQQALTIVTDLKNNAAPESEYVFTNDRSKAKKMSENAMLYLLYRLGYKGKTTVHGFRAAASTILNESGLFRADVIERQLAHVDGNSIRASYNHAQYLDERREMLQWWADQLDRLRSRISN